MDFICWHGLRLLKSLTEPLQSPFVSWGWVQCRPSSTGRHQSRSKDPQWSCWGFTAAASEGSGAVKAAPKNFDVCFFFFFLHLICRKMKSKPYTIISLIEKNCKLYIMFWSSLWIIQSVFGHSQTPSDGPLVYCFSQKLQSNCIFSLCNCVYLSYYLYISLYIHDFISTLTSVYHLWVFNI